MNSRLIVVTPAANRALTSAEAVKTELGIEGDDSDDLLLTMINQSSRLIESYCNRVFALQEYREEYRLPYRVETILAGQYPLRSISAIVEDGATLYADTDYEVDDRSGRLFRIASDRPFRWTADAKISVTYWAGYTMPGDSPDPHPLPGDLMRGCTELVKIRWLAKDRDPSVVREIVPQVYDVTFAGAPGSGATAQIPSQIIPWISAYRAVPVI